MYIFRPRLNSLRVPKALESPRSGVSDESVRGQKLVQYTAEQTERVFQEVLNFKALADKTYLYLSDFIHCDHIFIIEATEAPRAMLEEEGLKNRIYFQVLDQEAVVLYFAVAKISWGFGICKSFEIKMKNSRNVEVLRFVGSKTCGGKMEVSAHQIREKFGMVKQTGPCCTQEYILQKPNGTELAKVRPLDMTVNCCSCKMPKNYAIYEPNDCGYIGNVKKDWADSGLVDIIDWSHQGKGQIYGASFPEILNIPSKVLVLALLFAIKIMSNDII